MRRDAIVLAGGAALAGLALGLVTRVAASLPGELPFITKLGAPWLVVAFALGAWARRPVRGPLAGALALVVATGVYYAALRFVQDAYQQTPIGVWWVLAAVPGGALFGAAGAAWRQGRDPWRWIAVAGLSGALAGEALFFLWWHGGGAPGVLACELAAGLAAPILLLRPGRTRVAAIAAAVALTLAGALAVPVAWKGLETVRTLAHIAKNQLDKGIEID